MILTRKNKIRTRRSILIVSTVVLFICFGVSLLFNKQETITHTEIIFTDSLGVFSKDQILNIINNDKLVNTANINLNEVKNKLERMPWIATAYPYILNQILTVKIKFHSPVSKILTVDNNLYYLNEAGELVNNIKYNTSDVPLFVNYVPQHFTDSEWVVFDKQMVNMAAVITTINQKNKLIDYVDVHDNNDILLYTINPDVTYHIGDLNNYKSKLLKTVFFHEYQKNNNLNFKEVNVACNNQIIGIN